MRDRRLQSQHLGEEGHHAGFAGAAHAGVGADRFCTEYRICDRVLCGLCTGITSLVCPTYTTEYASKDIRGALGSGFQLFITIGILYAYLFGAVVESWRWLVLVCAAVGGVYLLLAIFIKESPTFLLSRGSEQSMQEPYILKPLAITLALMVFQQLAGVNAVIYNINLIFQASGTSISDDLSSIIVGIVQVIATAAGSLLIDRAGRKLLLCFSAFTMSVSIVSLGVFFYIKSSNESFAQEFLGWLPLTSLMIFISAFSIGYGPIPWVMMGELFYPNVKEAAGSMATTLNWTFVFIVTFVFAPLQDAIHDYGAYWLFGGLCAVNFLFCVLFVPETKGRTLQETMAHFGGPAA
ncbi:putative solute carrier family 2, facilitated glucose transporter member 8 isoform X2 [Penaeus vannamei]|uniref:Putative solute carrier family 2, facilitated glucose transporter member 8 isoform X2 n=1 Tax=Penaeus vannamei TaxID=6689 RepID=A0A3R7PG13_PENVA|nr:putative solute carrier family 2, facilitated glucose transporter member 8 isoform X2 [Penaeus vannamei]